MKTLQALNESGALLSLMLAIRNREFRATIAPPTRTTAKILCQLTVRKKSATVNGKRRALDIAV